MIQKVKEVSVEEEYIECFGIYNIPIYEDKRMVGRALVLNPSDREGLVLLDIYIYLEEDRRKGYADKAMWYLTQRFDAMWTSWLSTAGRELCLKHGFRIVSGPNKKGKQLLIYQKEETDEQKTCPEGSGQEEGGPEKGVGDSGPGEAGDSTGGQGGPDAQEDPQGPESPKEG